MSTEDFYFKGYTVDVEKMRERDPSPERGDLRYEAAYMFITDDKAKGYPVEPVRTENDEIILMLIKAKGSKEELAERPITPLTGDGATYFKQIMIPYRPLLSEQPTSNK